MWRAGRPTPVLPFSLTESLTTSHDCCNSRQTPSTVFRYITEVFSLERMSKKHGSASIGAGASNFARVLHGNGEVLYVNLDCDAKGLVLHLADQFNLESNAVELCNEKGVVVDLQSLYVTPTATSGDDKAEATRASKLLKPRTTYVALRVSTNTFFV